MTAPGNDLIILVLTLAVLLSSAYAVGRIHQWHKYGLERDEAYQIGYDKASRTIIGMMTGRHPRSTAQRAGRTTRPRVGPGGRHAGGHRLLADHRRPYPLQRRERDRPGT
jgi:hypothetical protein